MSQRPPWITGDDVGVILHVLAQQCQESAIERGFAAAVEAAMDQTRAWFDESGGVEIKELWVHCALLSLDQDDTRLMLEKLAGLVTFKKMDVGCDGEFELTEHFPEAQVLINTILLVFPSIKSLCLSLYDEDDPSDLQSLQADFLRPAGRPPLEQLELMMSLRRWKQASPFLPVLCQVQSVELLCCYDGQTQTGPLLDIEYLSALLAPSSRVVRLEFHCGGTLFDEGLFVGALTASVSSPDCRLEHLAFPILV